MAKLELIAEPGKHEIIVTRTFDAPRELVFKTYIDPTLIPQWWGLRDSETIVDQMEVRKGGIWRFVQQNAAGEQFAFNGVYHEIHPSDRIVNTFEYEGLPGHVLLETVTFLDEGDGRTKMIDSSVFQSVEDRDGMLMSGMEEGSTVLMDRFADLLAKVRVK
jgi:uncharacterized protein YndB with AHSA1/START domain